MCKPKLLVIYAILSVLWSVPKTKIRKYSKYVDKDQPNSICFVEGGISILMNL